MPLRIKAESISIIDIQTMLRRINVRSMHSYVAATKHFDVVTKPYTDIPRITSPLYLYEYLRSQYSGTFHETVSKFRDQFGGVYGLIYLID